MGRTFIVAVSANSSDAQPQAFSRLLGIPIRTDGNTAPNGMAKAWSGSKCIYLWCLRADEFLKSTDSFGISQWISSKTIKKLSRRNTPSLMLDMTFVHGFSHNHTFPVQQLFLTLRPLKI